MAYLLKKNISKDIIEKYKNSYFVNKLDLSNTYISLILHRKQTVPKRLAIAFTKTLDVNADIEDYFEYK